MTTLNYEERKKREDSFKTEEELKSIELSPGCRMQLDYTNELLRAESSGFAQYFRFSEVQSAELLIDEVNSSGKSTTSVLGRAALFGLATGGVGALVGAMTAKTIHKRDVKRVVLVVRADGWKFELKHFLYNKGYFKGYNTFEEAIRVGERVRDKLLERTEAKTPQPSLPIAEQIASLGALHSQGLLTSEEFAAAKRKLLS